MPHSPCYRPTIYPDPSTWGSHLWLPSGRIFLYPLSRWRYTLGLGSWGPPGVPTRVIARRGTSVPRGNLCYLCREIGELETGKYGTTEDRLVGISIRKKERKQALFISHPHPHTASHLDQESLEIREFAAVWLQGYQ